VTIPHPISDTFVVDGYVRNNTATVTKNQSKQHRKKFLLGTWSMALKFSGSPFAWGNIT